MIGCFLLAFFLCLLLSACKSGQSAQKVALDIKEDIKTSNTTEVVQIDTTKTTYSDTERQNKVVEETIVVTVFDTTKPNNPKKAVIEKKRKEEVELEEKETIIEDKHITAETTNTISQDADIDIKTEKEEEKKSYNKIELFLILAVIVLGALSILGVRRGL